MNKPEKVIFNVAPEFKKHLKIEAIKRGVTLTELILIALKKEVKWT